MAKHIKDVDHEEVAKTLEENESLLKKRKGQISGVFGGLKKDPAKQANPSPAAETSDEDSPYKKAGDFFKSRQKSK